MLKSNYKVIMPANLPSGKNVVFAWSWFNKFGNREMYMNCALVNIQGVPGGQLTGPPIFTANIGGTCHTLEPEEFVYPNPGPQVEYGGMYSGKVAPPTIRSGCDNQIVPAYQAGSLAAVKEDNTLSSIATQQLVANSIQKPAQLKTSPDQSSSVSHHAKVAAFEDGAQLNCTRIYDDIYRCQRLLFTYCLLYYFLKISSPFKVSSFGSNLNL